MTQEETTRPAKWRHFDKVVRDPEISPAAKALYAIMISYADKDGVCWPSIETLANHLGYSGRGIRKLIQELCEKGAIIKVRRGRTLSNLYSVTGTVVPITQSERNCGSYHSESERNCGSGVSGTVVPGERNCGSAEQIQLTGIKEQVNITTTSSPEEAQFLSILSSVENYPLDIEKDVAFLKKLKELFPNVDVVGEIRKWAVYKLDKPLKKNSNPRSQIRNWMEIASKKQEGGKPNGGRIKPVAKPSETFDDWL